MKPKLTGGTHWLEFLPDHVYCFLPSVRGDVGLVQVYHHMPDFVKEFLFCMEIKRGMSKLNIMYWNKIVPPRLLFLLLSSKRRPQTFLLSTRLNLQILQYCVEN